MAHSPSDATSTSPPSEPSVLVRWLGRPLSNWWCALGWIASTLIFIGIIQGLGGPFVVDSEQSLDSTLAIAHGQLSCAFPSGPELIAPLYPFLSGATLAPTHLGDSVPFPSRRAFGTNCEKAFHAIDGWAGKVHILEDALRVGYLAWLSLMVGLVSLLRASGRGKRGWEPATLILVACLPPVWLTLESSFHPQDLIAMGLVLCALASALRGWWSLAGVLVVLAVLTQQFAVLAAIPLLLFSPKDRRLSYLTGAALTVAGSLVLLYVFTSSRAVGAALIGTGNTTTSDSLVMIFHMHGVPLVFVSRLMPVILSVALAWFVVRNLGTAAEPAQLVAVVALSLTLRLVFEQNMFGYYFMALAVCLVVIDAIDGRFRGSLVAWLLMLSLTYLAGPTTTFLQLARVHWGGAAQQWMAPIVVVIGLLCVVWCLRRRSPTFDVFVWLGLVVGALLVWPPPRDPLSLHFSRMFWQVVLVSLGIALAASPLLESISAKKTYEQRNTGWTGALPSTP